MNSGVDPVGQGLTQSRDRRLPGQFFALTAPKGALRANLTADYWSEDLRYRAADLGLGDGGDETTFTASSFNEKTVTLGNYTVNLIASRLFLTGRLSWSPHNGFRSSGFRKGPRSERSCGPTDPAPS